jgi:putative ABC transport system permease protein
MKLIWALAFRNLLRNPRRSLTTGLAIMAGFVGLALIGGYILRVQKSLQANTVYINMQGHLQIHKKDSLNHFSISPKKYLIHPDLDQQLEAALQPVQSEIEFQSRLLTGAGLLVADSISQTFIARGAEADAIFKAAHHPSVNKWASGWNRMTEKTMSKDKLTHSDYISATERVAEIIDRVPKANDDFFSLPEDKRNIQMITRTYDNDLNAVNAELAMMHTTGVALTEDTSIRTSLSLLQNLFATDGYQYRILFLKDPGQLKNVQSRIKQAIDDAHLPFEVYNFTEDSIGEFYVGTMNFLYVMGAFFIFLISGMVALSIINSLTLGILERTKEIGTLKALGFNQKRVVGLFVRETVWLSIFSIAGGTLLAMLFTYLINSANFLFTPPGVEGAIKFELAPDFWTYLILATALGAIAILTSYFVSKSRLKASAIELLNDQGV